MANEIVIGRHFETLGRVLEENGLMNKSDCIFNVDESGINMELRKGKVVVSKKATNAHSVSKGARDHITVNCCVSASGQVLPPAIIYEKSFPSCPYKQLSPSNTLHMKSPNGYIDKELFLRWFTDLFIPQTRHLGKRMLIIDGHGSHLTLDFIDLARANDIIVYCLPPHTTHVLQPLDVAVYGPLKKNPFFHFNGLY